MENEIMNNEVIEKAAEKVVEVVEHAPIGTGKAVVGVVAGIGIVSIVAWETGLKPAGKWVINKLCSAFGHNKVVISKTSNDQVPNDPEDEYPIE